MANHLAGSKSRYLLQHAENPVDWHRWSLEPFEKARAENKPLLVSIGYSSCHWCHVMAHESFEDDEIARLINERFVAIKVDKEELPDVDGFYMEFLTQLSGRGGWPLNVFVNANQAPFYGITYAPPYQLSELLPYLADEYAKHEEIRDQRIDRVFAVGRIEPDKVDEALRSITFGPASSAHGPQFPQALYLIHALERGERELVRTELVNLVTKGLFDHVEGGWFRYSVDPGYKIPHFEKMLYDQASLLLLCADAFDLEPELASYAITRTVEWLERYMRLPSGLYGSATDADSAEGEGFYYTEPETNDEATRRLFRRDECGEHEGRFLPWIDLAHRRERAGEAEAIIQRCRTARAARSRPALDEKAIVSWNGFLGYALARCAERLPESGIGTIAQRLARDLSRFVAGSVPHVVYGDEPLQPEGYLEDYAAYLLFSAELARFGAVRVPDALLERIRSRFFRGGYWFHSDDPKFESLSLWQDTPFPSGGSMLLTALLTLSNEQLGGLDQSAIAEVAAQNPRFFALWCSALGRARAQRYG